MKDNNQTKLRTLNNMNIKHIGNLQEEKLDDMVSIYELKDEAIKWVKYFGKTKPDSWFIKHFFNLTKEDLQ